MTTIPSDAIIFIEGERAGRVSVSRRKKQGSVLFSPRGTSITGAAAREVGKKLPGPPGLVVTGLVAVEEEIKREKKRQDYLNHLFGISDPLYVKGSNDHPDFPLLTDELLYPSDKNAAEVIRNDFFKDMEFEEIKEYIPEKTVGSLITLGSSVASPITRQMLGDPRESQYKPKFLIQFVEYKYEVSIYYNYAPPDPRTPRVNNYQSGRRAPWLERNWGVVSREGGEWFPRFEKGWLLCDYLLVTRISSPIRGAGDILIFGGTHGAGTQATELLLRNLDLNELETIINTIGNSPHFQTLFRVSDISHEGHSSGKSLRLAASPKPLYAIRG